MSQPTGPLQLEPVFLPKVWAAKGLPPALAPVMSAPPDTGEIWLASDRHHPTRVAAGAHAGKGLDELVAELGSWITGRDDGSGFPLLLKVLVVGQWLSVQVHPDDAAARRLENEPCGKTEAWFVLHAENGAEIIHGLTAGADIEAVRNALAAGTVAEVLARVPARTGDTFFLDAGTIHAPGPGLTILEIQQPSDLTYRFYDWDRPDRDGSMRELHVDKALEVLNASGPGAPVGGAQRVAGYDQLVANGRFALYRAAGSIALEPLPGGGPSLVFASRGSARLHCAEAPATVVGAGTSWLLPAGIDRWRLDLVDGEIFLATAGARG